MDKEYHREYMRKWRLLNIEKVRESARASYHRYPERNLENYKKTKKAIREHISFYLSSNRCVDCVRDGVDWDKDKRVLEFDHCRGKKICNVVSATNIAMLKREIEKCDLVCANHHSIRTKESGKHMMACKVLN